MYYSLLSLTMISFVLFPQASRPSINFDISELVYCVGPTTFSPLTHLRYDAIETKFRLIVVSTCIRLFQGFLLPVYFWQVKTFGRFMAMKICVIIVAKFPICFNIHLIVRHHQIQQSEQTADTFIIRRLKKSAFNTFLVFIFLLICSLPFLYVYFNHR